MSKLTLQINSKDALERLIGGDTAVEVEIRNNIVQDFTNKYLKGLMNSSTIQNIVGRYHQDIRKSVQEEVEKNFGKPNAFYSSVELNPEIKAAIKKEIENNFSALVDKAVKEKFSDIEKHIQQSVNLAVDYQIGVKVRELVKQKIEAALKV